MSHIPTGVGVTVTVAVDGTGIDVTVGVDGTGVDATVDVTESVVVDGARAEGIIQSPFMQ